MHRHTMSQVAETVIAHMKANACRSARPPKMERLMMLFLRKLSKRRSSGKANPP